MERIANLFRQSGEKPTNLGEELRKKFQGKDFQDTFETAAPFFFGSIVSWPMFWLYKGLVWHGNRSQTTLAMYIKKTFFQAKLMQFAIISAGILATVSSTSIKPPEED